MADSKIIPLNVQAQGNFMPDKNSLAGKNLHLSIEVREANVLACLLDKDANKYLAWASYSRKDEKNATRQVENILQEEIFNCACSSSSIVLVHNSAMLIPSAFFSQELVKDYLKHQNLIKTAEVPYSDFIKNNDCYSIYAVDSSDYYTFKKKYPHATFRHHSSIFVEYILALHPPQADISKNEVHVCVFAGYMDVVALEAGKLILYNRYYIQTPNDFTYFLLWVYEELKLKAENTSCTFYGEIDEKSEMYGLAMKYIKNIRMAEKTKRFNFSAPLEGLPAQAYYSLFMQYLCI